VGVIDPRGGPGTGREIALVEVIDRVLGAGVVITGDVTISLADVDLVYLDLRLLLGSVGTIRGGRGRSAAVDITSLHGAAGGSG
jgi:hypothetical protein